MHFTKNKDMRIGVELELQMIDPDTLNLKPIAPEIIADIQQHFETPHIKSELFKSMIEIDTPILDSAAQVGKSLRQPLSKILATARKFNTKIMMSGTHPFAHYSERQLSGGSRYYKMVDRNQLITRRLQIFGLHVHLGMRDGEHAIIMNNALCHYLPLILAISANSPFWEGDDTGLASSRITLFEAMPTGGHPYSLNSWSEFEDIVEKLVISRSITSLKDLWWDIRPNPDYGTLEVRIADCPTTIVETEALVALIHALAQFIDKDLKNGKKFAFPPEWILRENKWRASRHGISADLIIDSTGKCAPLKEVWINLQETLTPTITSLGYQEQFIFLNRMIGMGPGYVRQRKAFAEGNLENVIQHLIRETESDQPIWN